MCLDKELLPAHRMKEKVGGDWDGDRWELVHSLGFWEPVVLETEEPWGRSGLEVCMGQQKYLIISACEVGIVINAHFSDEETESQRGLVT